MGKLHELYKQTNTDKNYDAFFTYLDTEPNLKIDEVDEHGNRIIDYAVMAGDLKGAEKILQKGASPKGVSTRSPLFLAIFSNKIHMIPLLVHFGADINERNAAQMSLLYWTTTQKDLAGMRQLINSGINLHTIRGGYLTPLHDSLSPKLYIEGVKLLLENGAGIMNDFSRISNLTPELLANAVLIGAVKDDNKLSREVNGFSKAIFTTAEFDKAVQDEQSFDYVGLYRTVKQLISAGKQDAELVRFEAYLQPLAQKAKLAQESAATQVQKLEPLSTQTARKLGMFAATVSDLPENKLEKLSSDAKQQVEEQRILHSIGNADSSQPKNN
jgi:hypothetical protein